MHLRDAHYKGATALGHVGYAFPHDDGRGWSDQVYAPDVPHGSFYQSDARDAATFERRADEHWEQVTGRATARRFGDKH
jgi:putative ATPase